jgi:hypothetical protein
VTPHHAFALDWPTLGAELRRELSHRRQFYPGRVEQHRMTQAEADHGIAVAAAWLEDAERMHARWAMPAAPPHYERPPMKPPAHNLSWRDRRSGLLRELAFREKLYPQWILEGRMTDRQAADRVACLRCLLEIYHNGWDWRGSDGQLPCRSPIATAEYRELLASIAASQQEAQKELAL